MSQQITGGIRTRLLMLVVGVAVPLAYVGLSGILAMWGASRSQLNDSVKKQAELAAVAFEQWVEAQREPLATIAAYPIEQTGNEADFLKTLRLIVDTRAHWMGLRVVDASGNTLIAQPQDAPPLTAGIASNLLSELGHKSWAIEADWTEGATRGILVIAAHIKQGGAVIAQVDVAAVGDLFYREVDLSDQDTLAVFGPQRRILIYRNESPETYMGTDLSGSPLFAALDNRRAAVTEAESLVDGTRRVYGLANSTQTGCVVAIGVPSDALYSPARKQLDRYLILSVTALLCAAAAATVIARGIARPVRRLSVAARRFGAGDLSTRARFKSGGEIEELYSSFNAMAEQIEEREARLKELDQMKSDFVSGVSHELRTPLTTIKTLTRVLLRSKLDEQERREHLETIAAECDRQIDLVLNLLDLSRVEAGTFNVTLTRVDVADVIRACILIERHSAAARRQQLVEDLPDALAPALADRVALRRVLCCLVENSIKYTPEGGRITLSARADEQEVNITITDTGRGIMADDLPHIFEKFYRGRPCVVAGAATAIGDVTGLAEAPGVGLGLYLAQTIVGQIGGRIGVESVAGCGSTFTISLPIRADGGEDDEEGREN